MSINERNLLQVLLIISLGLGCWARPKPARQQLNPALNEVTAHELDLAADPQIPNDLLEQLSTMRSSAGHQHKKRRPNASNYWKPLQHRLQHSPFRGRGFYNVPPGGGNYFSNDALPLSTYEIYDPQPIYSTAYF
ncbi:hypothetical protein KR044_002827 [Drosophila immigrans]|nr:hypothetical protein KR044_002827 [Drosophila immigrans]